MPQDGLLFCTSRLWNRILGFFVFLGLFGFLGQVAQAQFPTEKPQGYVNDLAGVLSPAARQQLEALCTELDQKTKAQLAIVTVRSLQGRPLEEFTIDLATQWGIGPKGSDRGVLLFLAIQDRRSRIEVGYGLEPIIPDGRAGGILRSMTPHLQNGDYDSAIALGAASIAQIIAQDAGVPLSAVAQQPPASAPPTRQRPGLGQIIYLLFLLVFSPFFLFSRRRRGYRGGSVGPWIGGFGGGGGGGGFGGFGGGSFGGGGASGSW